MDLLRPEYTDKHREAADRLRSRLNIAGSLLDARMAFGMTQQELGQRAHTKQSRVSEIEAMKGNPTLDTLDRIGRVVGLALDYVPRRSAAPAVPEGYREYSDVLHVEGQAESSKEANVYRESGASVGMQVATHG